MYFTLDSTITHSKPILTVSISEHFILIGSKSHELLKITIPSLTIQPLVELKKSIRSTSINSNFFACVSYDTTGILYKDNAFFDIIDGPDTELKCVTLSADNTQLAIATRGKNVWLFSIKEDCIELECTFDDHIQDVKGVKFINDRLYSYSYDRSIKVYEREDDCWDMIKNVEDHECTVWDIVYMKSCIVACDNHGNLYFYEPEYMRLKNKIKASRYPICAVCRVDDEHFVFVLNRNMLCVMDLHTNVVQIIEDRHKLEINSIDYCEENGRMVSVCDGGIVNIFIKVELN